MLASAAWERGALFFLLPLDDRPTAPIFRFMASSDHADRYDCVEQVSKLAQAAWELRDALLRQGALTPEIVRLEVSIHQLEAFLHRLAVALDVTVPELRLPDRP